LDNKVVRVDVLATGLGQPDAVLEILTKWFSSCAPKSMCREPPRGGGRSCARALCIAISDDRAPIFAQAAGAALTYVAGIVPSPAGSAVLVPQNSPIQKITELKGKKIAFQKGSSAHLLLVNVLEKAGLKYTDIQPISLPPADARAAFVKGSVDAWVIWDPFYAAAEEALKARVLIDGTGLNKQGGYFLAARKFATEQPETLKAILEEVQKLEVWSKDHRDEVASTLAPVLGIDIATLKKATNRRSFGIVPITDELLAEQQKVADTYYQLKLIPKHLNIKEATLTKEEYAKIALKS
jgi:sulfonate transport system substrate-binding protein